MNNLKCKKCGNIVRKSDKFCINCGEKIDRKNLENQAESKIINNSNSIIKTIIITSFLTVFLMFGLFYLYDNYIKDNSVIDFSNKNVTINDSGIANSVDKVYDSVVVVKSLVNGDAYGSGSGFVFKTDNKYGYILTNCHVTAEATEVKVMFTDKKEVDATIVGQDEYADISVLKVDKKYVKEIAITGNNKKMRLGDTTFAVGAPVDPKKYSWSVTRGVLSGKDRTVSAGNSYMKVLQTDTPINAGNSGGPLCNANGEVIGITNMKLASEQIEGMSFAIPIETALDYANKFMTGKEIARPFIGVSLVDETSFFSSDVKVIIAEVQKDTPAAKSGLKRGDIITKLDDEEIENSSHFKSKLYTYKKGDKIKLTVIRDGKEKTFELELSENSSKA